MFGSQHWRQRPGWEWVREGVAPSPVGVRGCQPGKFLKTQMLNPAFWWLLHSLVGSRGRAYPSKQQECQGLNQFQNFNFSAVVAPLFVRTKNQSNGNYETRKFIGVRAIFFRGWKSFSQKLTVTSKEHKVNISK